MLLVELQMVDNRHNGGHEKNKIQLTKRPKNKKPDGRKTKGRITNMH